MYGCNSKSKAATLACRAETGLRGNASPAQAPWGEGEGFHGTQHSGAAAADAGPRAFHCPAMSYKLIDVVHNHSQQVKQGAVHKCGIVKQPTNQHLLRHMQPPKVSSA